MITVELMLYKGWKYTTTDSDEDENCKIYDACLRVNKKVLIEGKSSKPGEELPADMSFALYDVEEYPNELPNIEKLAYKEMLVLYDKDEPNGKHTHVLNRVKFKEVFTTRRSIKWQNYLLLHWQLRVYF